MDQEPWELVEILFPWRAEAMREAMKSLAKAVQVTANPPKIDDFWKESEELDKKGASQGVRSTSASDETQQLLTVNSFAPGDDLMLGIGRQAR